MSDSLPPVPDALSAVLALAARIERDSRFEVRDVFALPLRPFVEAKDITNGLVVTFSSEAEYVLYLDVVPHDRTGGARYAQASPQV